MQMSSHCKVQINDLAFFIIILQRLECNGLEMCAVSPYSDNLALQGGFILDMGVHFIAGLRMVC
jgi:hypothetical protein